MGALALLAAPLAAQGLEIALPDGTPLTVEVDAAAGDSLVLWLPSGFGRQPAEARLARELAAAGVEVWRAELIEARFLPPLESSLDRVPEEDVVALIDAARATGKRVYLLAAARGAILALRGAHAWLERHPQGGGLGGAVLLHPNLYLGPPEPGREAVYHPAVARTRLPVFIIQPPLSPWRWRLAETLAELERGGARVFVQTIPGNVRDRFYFRPDATAEEEVRAAQLPADIRRAVAQLKTAALARLPASPTTARQATAAGSAVGRRGLNPYTGDPVPPPLKLADLAGHPHDLADYRGQAVLVNFWASWCPPCVHEMPSMQRLKERMAGKPFTILAVNMAEDANTIRDFLENKVKVDFAILLDADGAALKRWKVFVFPTSFVIGPDGRIRYGLYGEMQWDTDEAVAVIEGLLASDAEG